MEPTTCIGRQFYWPKKILNPVLAALATLLWVGRITSEDGAGIRYGFNDYCIQTLQ